MVRQSSRFLAAAWRSHAARLSALEKDSNGDALWVWCYPSVTAELRALLLRKCCLTDESKLLHTFVFGQYKRTWFYITTVEVQDSPALKKVGLGLRAPQQSTRKTCAELPLLLNCKHGAALLCREVLYVYGCRSYPAVRLAAFGKG